MNSGTPIFKYFILKYSYIYFNFFFNKSLNSENLSLTKFFYAVLII